MATLRVYYDEDEKCVQVITPKAQGREYSNKDHFDMRWGKLAQHVSRGQYHHYEVV